MNRRSFLPRLVLGAVALPAIAKAASTARVKLPHGYNYGRGLVENVTQRHALEIYLKHDAQLRQQARVACALG